MTTTLQQFYAIRKNDEYLWQIAYGMFDSDVRRAFDFDSKEDAIERAETLGVKDYDVVWVSIGCTVQKVDS